MRKGDFDGYHHVTDHHFAHIDFVWWWLLRARSLVVAESIAPNSQAHRGLKEARLAGQPLGSLALAWKNTLGRKANLTLFAFVPNSRIHAYRRDHRAYF